MRQSLAMQLRPRSLAVLVALVLLAACGSSGKGHHAAPAPANNAAPATPAVSEPMLGEIHRFAGQLGGNVPPKGWLFTDGSLLPISTNTRLFSVLGTRFGGNGTSNFGLPNIPTPGDGTHFIISVVGRYPPQNTTDASGEYVGQVTMFAGTFAPSGWHAADGSILPISANQTLFNVLGSKFGGDGKSTFALPKIDSGFANITYLVAETGTPATQAITSFLYSEVGMFGGTQVPPGWLPAQGALLPIPPNQALYSLLGTRFGGNGTTTFQLPNIGSIPNIAFLINNQGTYPANS
jgi:microcystin-dependent protein